jgi:hypothetical protein
LKTDFAMTGNVFIPYRNNQANSELYDITRTVRIQNPESGKGETNPMYDCIREKHPVPIIQTEEERVATARAICIDPINAVHSLPKEIHQDSQGFTYRAVRFCDLNLIRDK